ncbi:MAG TPA: hypothetical protein PK156_21305 [Polyangium sp.]|nr:hypothetical protein [Polyangium sp.]
MKRLEIDALVRAHRGRAHPVASLHVLRQIAIEPDDQVFLCEHARELTIPDLLLWRKRCAPGFTGAVIRELARIAIDDPVLFKFEVLEAPRFALADEEWIELADLTRGKVPAVTFERILARGARTEPLPAPREMDPGDEDLGAFLESTLADFEPAMPEVLPQGFVDAEAVPEVILERARNAWSVDERVVLLEWLTSRLPRKPLVEIATTALRAGENDPRLRAWLAGQLASRAAWEAHGVDVVLALLDRQAFSELSTLMTLVWSDPPGGKPESERPRGLLDAMMMALALGFIHQIREKLSSSMIAQALVYLSALACLDLPTRLSRSIHDLLHAPGAEGEVRTLIEMNVRLVKHDRGRQAAFEDIAAAIHCLADASSEG